MACSVDKSVIANNTQKAKALKHKRIELNPPKQLHYGFLKRITGCTLDYMWVEIFMIMLSC